jgi:ribosomal protein S18 acetylase RimI-like enzyme
MRVTLRHGLPEKLRPQAVDLYWQAFGGKLGRVMGPDRKAIAFLQEVIRADHALVALDDQGQLLGLLGFKSPAGSFAGGDLQRMRRHYGVIGCLWRVPLLWLLGRDIDNDRFLIDGLCVDRQSRSLGIGTALLNAACQEARSRGYEAIRLDVVDTNWRARQLYERQGFQIIRRSPLGPLRHAFGFKAALTMVRAV